MILGGLTKAGRDSWLCLLFSQAAAVPVLLAEARLLNLYPGKDLFGILEAVFGRTVGKIATALLVWYAVQLCAMALRTYSEFVEIVAMPETPELPLLILLLLVGVYLAKCGIGVLGKWSVGVICFAIFILLLTSLLLFNQMDFRNVLPVLDNDAQTLLLSTYGQFSMPLGESVLILSIADCLPEKPRSGRLLFGGSVLATLILFWMMLRNLTALGPALMQLEYFPSYGAARIIHVSDFLARIEGTISTNFILFGVTRITVCLLAASRGIDSLFGLKGRGTMILPAALVSLALSVVLADSVMELVRFRDVYPLYAVPFQVVIPLAAWVCGEIRAARRRPRRPAGQNAVKS